METTRPRADLGFGDDALAGFDPADWAPAPARAKPAPDATQKAARATGFHSREAAGQGATPAAPAADTPPRRRRTGRNTQFNLKVRPDTIAAFTAIADAHGWGLGETLERAVELLEERYSKGQGAS